MHVYAFLAAGVASYFFPSRRYQRMAGACAMNHVRIGTTVSIVNSDNGDQATCVIVSSGPFVPGRIIDVDFATAHKLGMVQSGLAHARVYVRTR